MVRKSARSDLRGYFYGWNFERLLATFIESGYHVRSSTYGEVTVSKDNHYVRLPYEKSKRYIWPKLFWARFRDANNLRVVTLHGRTTFMERT